MLSEREFSRANHICKKALGIVNSIPSIHNFSERELGFIRDTEYRLNRFGRQMSLSQKQWNWLEDICRRAI